MAIRFAIEEQFIPLYRPVPGVKGVERDARVLESVVLEVDPATAGTRDYADVSGVSHVESVAFHVDLKI